MRTAVTTPKQKRIALGIALAADVDQLALAPRFAEGALSPFADALDVVVVAALVLTLGWRWRTVLALGVELIPGLALFPSWTALALTLPAAQPAAVAELSAPRSAG
jgi:hypothetical protein